MHIKNATPPPKFFPALEKLKISYFSWFGYYSQLPKTHRYTLGSRIDSLLVEIIEYTATAGFSKPNEKLPYVRIAIRKLDTVKVLLFVLWETKSLDNKKYIHLSEQLNEIGRIFGAWHGNLINKNSSNTEQEKK